MRLNFGNFPFPTILPKQEGAFGEESKTNQIFLLKHYCVRGEKTQAHWNRLIQLPVPSHCQLWSVKQGKKPLWRLLIWGSRALSFVSLSQEAGPWAQHEASLSSIKEPSEQRLCNGPVCRDGLRASDLSVTRGGRKENLAGPAVLHPRETAPQPISEMKTRWHPSPRRSRQIVETRKQRDKPRAALNRKAVRLILGKEWLLRFNKLSRQQHSARETLLLLLTGRGYEVPPKLWP